MEIGKAAEIYRKCGGSGGGCDTCPLSKEARYPGIDLVFTVCGLFSLIRVSLKDSN